MTWLLIDAAAVARFERVNQTFIGDEPRRYYVTMPHDDRLALVVCRHDLRLEDLAGLVVDAAIGWDDGLEWFFHHKGERHTKVTIYRALHDHAGRSERTLSDILQDAPRRKED